MLFRHAVPHYRPEALCSPVVREAHSVVLRPVLPISRCILGVCVGLWEFLGAPKLLERDLKYGPLF